MRIGCDDDVAGGVDDESAIRVIRANYGRFSISLCNKHGFTDWSVNCAAPGTTKILRRRSVSQR